MLKFTEAAPTDGFAVKVDHYLLLMPQPALASSFLKVGRKLINYHVEFSWIISSFHFHLERDSVS